MGTTVNIAVIFLGFIAVCINATAQNGFYRPPGGQAPPSQQMMGSGPGGPYGQQPGGVGAPPPQQQQPQQQQTQYGAYGQPYGGQGQNGPAPPMPSYGGPGQYDPYAPQAPTGGYQPQNQHQQQSQHQQYMQPGFGPGPAAPPPPQGGPPMQPQMPQTAEIAYNFDAYLKVFPAQSFDYQKLIAGTLIGFIQENSDQAHLVVKLLEKMNGDVNTLVRNYVQQRQLGNVITDENIQLVTNLFKIYSSMNNFYMIPAVRSGKNMQIDNHLQTYNDVEQYPEIDLWETAEARGNALAVNGRKPQLVTCKIIVDGLQTPPEINAVPVQQQRQKMYNIYMADKNQNIQVSERHTYFACGRDEGAVKDFYAVRYEFGIQQNNGNRPVLIQAKHYFATLINMLDSNSQRTTGLFEIANLDDYDIVAEIPKPTFGPNPPPPGTGAPPPGAQQPPQAQNRPSQGGPQPGPQPGPPAGMVRV